MENLYSLQDNTLEAITKVATNFKKTSKSRLSKSYVQIKITTLDQYWDSFRNIHMEILKIVKKEQMKKDSYFMEDIFSKGEEEYTLAKSTLLDSLQSFESSVTTPSKPGNKGQEVKLPRISLPTFGANYTEWQSFHDLFVALIHKNETLEDVQKLHYLKSSLTGEAEVLLRQVMVTSENYAEAWSMLKKRYHNKRYLANCIFKKFFNQKSLHQEAASSLKGLLDVSVECMNSLKNLGLPVVQWDAIVNFVMVSKLDPATHKQWERVIGEDGTDDLPSFERLKSFLETQFRTLEMVEPENKVKAMKPKTCLAAMRSENKQCLLCKENHYIYSCKEFVKLPVDQRYNFVKKENLCYNCLIPNHSVFKCRQSGMCRICKRRHHSLLHREFTKRTEELTDRNKEETTSNKEEVSTVTAHMSKGIQAGHQVLLATALVEVLSRNGETHVCRALIDQGSEASFVTARVVELLGLRKTRVSGVVSGVGKGKVCIKYLVELHIKSRCNSNFAIKVKAYVLKTLTGLLPSREVKGYDWPQLKNMNLADPTYGVPSRIDILLGVDVFGKIIDSGLLKGPGNVIAQYTHLGWIVSGDTYLGPTNSQNYVSLHAAKLVEEDNNFLKKFWEIETADYTSKKIWTKEEERCEEHYINTTTREESGRYVVHLPLKQNLEDAVKACGDTKPQAIIRLKQLERRFAKQEDLKKEYQKVIHEYLNLGHMKKVGNEDTNKGIYLAHHAVIKEDKETTKVRVVFDASGKGPNGYSLNNCMMVGPTLQPDLRALIIRWRSHKFCVVGDIIKMYRQIRITNKHTDLQRIVWRDDPSEDIQSYQLLTVTFGTAAAPYLAVRTLNQLADDEKERYPHGAAVIKNSFFMDDFMYGHQELTELKQVCDEVNNLLMAGGFQMQKWSSNSDELLELLYQNKDMPDPADRMEIRFDKVIKILGLSWDRKNDTFQVTVNQLETRRPVTKRSVLSEVASLFDPFGWLAPVIITAKILIQRLWLCNLGWDDDLPSELIEEWATYREELKELKTVELPRWTKMTSHCTEVQLHGFADASSVAYAAVVYVRVVDEENEVHVNLVASKTKVAPLKQLTIPRLELCAAVMLARLLREISSLWEINMSQVFAWTDSQVVLSWLQGQPSRWQVFVGNRVSEIVQLIDNDRWNHVRSADNPADLASRGVAPSDLTHCDMWWTGPNWLRNIYLAINKSIIPQTDLETKKSIYTICVEEPIWERFSSLSRMKRVLAMCLRFIKYKNEREAAYLTVEELNVVEEKCIKYYQNLIFKEEIQDLKKKGRVKKRSSLISLNPFLDDQGYLRVGGRLAKANIPEDMKHPIIIPGKQHLTKLIIAEAHTRTFHGGLLQMLIYIRTKYWVIGLKSAVRQYIHNCRVCIIDKAKVKQQLMGQLPPCRVNPSRPFLNSGVDYAGPVYLRTTKGRGYKSIKGYICLFVCMATRAIHLEAVTDLTSQAFIAAFRRFVARRGQCAHLWSDNGKNFIGADKELRAMFEQGKNNVAAEIAELLANDGTTWHFIPPRTPNFGGLWESAIRSAKKHLNRINGSTKLTYEEMATLLTQIEACLNSRPICYTENTNDTLNPLTPGHFLIGEPLITVPDSTNYDNKGFHTLSRWQLLQQKMQEFWRRWKAEYLNTLQQRHKWHNNVPSPLVGDIVVIKEEDLPPAKWLVGRIVSLHPGTDQLVRVVTVQTKGGNLLKRPLAKLIFLPR